MQTADTRPVSIVDRRSTALTPRGAAVLAILRVQEIVRELDAADRAYLAPYAADLLVDLCTDALPAVSRGGCGDYSKAMGTGP